MKSVHLFSLLLAFCAPATSASAASILFNFGGTSYSGANAPGHVNGTATGTIWNTVATDTATGIVDSTGASTSIALDFGTSSTGTSTTPSYSGATKVADYPTITEVTGGIFDSDLGRSNAVRDGSTVGISLNISNLPAGEYAFYLTSFRGDSPVNLTRAYNLYAGVAADPITDFSAFSLGSLNNSNTTSWEEGVNYLAGTFVIDGTNDNFSIFSNNSTYVGVLTSLEIVSIPEPSSIAILSLAPILLGIRRRR
jgi:hypothetical protein